MWSQKPGQTAAKQKQRQPTRNAHSFTPSCLPGSFKPWRLNRGCFALPALLAATLWVVPCSPPASPASSWGPWAWDQVLAGYCNHKLENVEVRPPALLRIGLVADVCPLRAPTSAASPTLPRLSALRDLAKPAKLRFGWLGQEHWRRKARATGECGGATPSIARP